MKKYLAGFLLLSSVAEAQMVDLLGSMAVQGSLSVQSTQSAVQGISAAKRLRFLQDLQDIILQIKTGYFGNYTGVDKNSVSGSFLSDISWDVGSVGNNLFYIQLNQIDNQTCRYLLSQNLSARNVLVNGISDSHSCSNTNTIKYIFD